MAVNATLLGKKGYAPEEQLLQGKVYKNSDFYALAVTALVLMTGKEPHLLYDSFNGVWLWGKEIKVRNANLITCDSDVTWNGALRCR